MNSKRNLVAVILVAILVNKSAAANSEYKIGLHQTGKEAEAIYRALEVPEQVEKLDITTNSTRIYKIGQSIFCLKEVLNAGGKDGQITTKFLCSAGFNSKGVADQ